MNSSIKTVVSPEDVVSEKERAKREDAWYVVVWNDPVNLMSYVTLVFQKVFGWQRQVAEKHMLEVHHKGRSIVARESREKAEHYVHQLHNWGLTATLESGD